MRPKRSYTKKPIKDRFWGFVPCTPKKAELCWVWGASLTNGGYGQFSVNRVMKSAHRIAWTLENGEIPGNLFVLHKCDNRKCVRPSHLFLGTSGDNIRDCLKKGRLRPRHHKLKPTDVVKMILLHRNGASINTLSVLYSVSKTHVTNIINRKQWKVIEI